MFGGGDTGEFAFEWTFHDPRVQDTPILKLRGMLHVTVETVTWNCFVGLAQVASDSKVLAGMDGRAFYLTSPFKIYLSA
jgi:hypothetical protein